MTERPTYETNPTSTTMLVIDIQRAFGEVVPVPDVEQALGNIRKLTQAWREARGRLIFSRHIYEQGQDVGRLADFLPGIADVLSPSSAHATFHPRIVLENDEVLPKTRFSALKGTDLADRLRTSKTETVIVAGLTTPICVQATVDDLMMSDFQVIVADDACASQPMGELTPQEAHTAAIERMSYVFAEVTTTDELLERVRHSRSATAL